MSTTPESTDLQDPMRYAALVRPMISRAHGVRFAARPRLAELGDRTGLALGLLTEFGWALLAQPRTETDLAAAHRYKPGELHAALRAHAEQGILNLTGDKTWEPTERGRDLTRRIHAALGETVRKMWAPVRPFQPKLLLELTDTFDRLIAAAAPTGGPAFAMMTTPASYPVEEDLGLYARMNAFRHHRADAHAAAWQAAGLTAEEIVGLKTGELREAIETDTNARDAGPYLVLTPDERLVFMSGLGSLPG